MSDNLFDELTLNGYFIINGAKCKCIWISRELKIVVCLEYKEHDPRPMRRSFTSSPVLAAQNPKYELINSVEPWNTDGYVF